MSPRSTVHTTPRPDPPRAGHGSHRQREGDKGDGKRHAAHPPSARGRRARAEIEHSARELFATNGYFRTTVEDIAKAAGRSKAAFYQYFANREELLMRLSEHFTLEVAGRARETGINPQSADDGPYFLAQAQAYWDSYVAHRGVMVAIFQLATVNDRFAARQAEIRTSGQVGIQATIRRAQERGNCAKLDPEIAAAALAAMIEHFCFVTLRQMDSELAVDDKKAVKTIATLWHRTLYGELR